MQAETNAVNNGGSPKEAAARLMRALEQVTGAGILTPDVGGTATTKDVTSAMVDAIHSSNI
jgi:tartrate dehydrogenase/decarboxylase/D-malate dehydrogenase